VKSLQQVSKKLFTNLYKIIVAKKLDVLNLRNYATTQKTL